MKHYNIQNYIRYKKDLEQKKKRIHKKYPPEIELTDYKRFNRDDLVIMFMPLVENIARKFATSQQASGVMAITDMIQEGNVNLIKAVDRIDWNKMDESEDQEKNNEVIFI